MKWSHPSRADGHARPYSGQPRVLRTTAQGLYGEGAPLQDTQRDGDDRECSLTRFRLGSTPARQPRRELEQRGGAAALASTTTMPAADGALTPPAAAAPCKLRNNQFHFNITSSQDSEFATRASPTRVPATYLLVSTLLMPEPHKREAAASYYAHLLLQPVRGTFEKTLPLV